MQRKKVYSRLFLAVVAAILFSLVGVGSVSAQDAAMNAYSPYTMYGVGELHSNGNAINRALGGSGVAMRSTQMANLLNPAGYSATLRKSFIFEVGLEGNFVKNEQRKYSSLSESNYTTSENAHNSVNLREIAVQMPVAKGLGFGLSLVPYSSVGYKMHSLEQSEDIWGSLGGVMYNYHGDGDITEVKAGFGWEVFRGFSIGIAAKYYWGYISHNYTTSIYGDYVGPGDFVSTKGVDEYAISNFKFQAGLQWNVLATKKRLLTIGATYDYGGPLLPKISKTVYIGDLTSTVVSQGDSKGQMRLPHAVNAGISYQDAKFVANFDYEYQNWGGSNAFYTEDAYSGMSIGYVDTNTYKFGFEYTPNRFDARSYLSRVAYRVGVRYGDFYQTINGVKLNQYSVTAGLGLPLRFMGSTSINAGIELGGRGKLSSVEVPGLSSRVGLVRQRYIKVHLGFSLFGEDYWFVRPKID